MADVVSKVSDVVVLVMEYHLIFYLIECLRAGYTSNKIEFLFPAFCTPSPRYGASIWSRKLLRSLAPLASTYYRPMSTLNFAWDYSTVLSTLVYRYQSGFEDLTSFLHKSRIKINTETGIGMRIFLHWLHGFSWNFNLLHYFNFY